VSNGTSCSTNSILELLYGEVGGAELQKREWSGAKHQLNMFWKRDYAGPSRPKHIFGYKLLWPNKQSKNTAIAVSIEAGRRSLSSM
jgi:hypothetical protein